VAVRLLLVDVHRGVLAPVADEVGLPVAVDVEAPDRPPSLDGRLPDRGPDALSAPDDLAREADVDGDEVGHAAW
jgi:hypothetical protein